MTCTVVIGGALSNKKGVNTPSIVLPISPLTPKDRRYDCSELFRSIARVVHDLLAELTCRLLSRLVPLTLTYRDLEFILTLDIDWVALSFVQRPEDISELRAISGKKVRVSHYTSLVAI